MIPDRRQKARVDQQDVLSLQWKDGVGYLQPLPWEQDKRVVCGFSTRWGGISQGPYKELNLGSHVGDRLEAVQTNRRRFSQVLGISQSPWVTGQQVHGKKVMIVSRKEQIRVAAGKDTAIPGVDGLITAEPGLWLAAFFADCVPILLWDKKQQVVAVVHAGWRGTLLQVGKIAVAHMVKHLGCKPSHISAVIGPAIGSCCYEVGEDLAQTFLQLYRGREDIVSKREGTRYLDLKQANRVSLCETGLLPAHIHVTGLCTACRTDLFYSHRREGEPTGRMAAVIGLQEG